MGGKKKLTEPPKDLKEAIDWITWVCGYGQGSQDYKSQLAAAVTALTNFKNAFKGMFGTVNDPTGLIKKFADGLGRGFLGYNGQGTDDFSGSGIVASNGKYKSAYHNCNWSSDAGPDYAKIFLFLAPLVYYFVTFLYWMCNKSSWKHKQLNSASSSNPLFYLMLNMDYTPSQLDEVKTGSQIAEILEGHYGFDELSDAYQGGAKSSYETFLQQLEENVAGSPLNHPLASCYKLAKEYFESQSKFKAPNASEINEAIKAIKGNLIQLSAAEEYSSSGDSSTNPYDNLKPLITQLLSAVQKFQAKEPEQFGQGVHHAAGQAGKEAGESGGQPSSGSSIAGALTTLGLGGGAAAAYLVDLGGAKTFVDGLLRIG
ncbi:variant erythrocyte surface antigen-1 family protein [Babesia caballi]|uniref:Variant erythrocyte surface antigen-1 family protein n=1 Tax=Babesia caballi TaxID=5871 RepID=A0AAV4LMX2_BABCB|nr:variant erythrocyte surface antigen-1 family protein [Babesia caballi]